MTGLRKNFGVEMKSYGKIFAITLLGLFFACSGETDKSLFKEAQKHLARQEYKQAVDSFVEILDKFPDGKFAPRAALEVAKIYHGHAVKQVPRDESYKIAVKYYKLCNSLAPNTDDGANALFMAAFIQANEIKDYENAKKTYQKFIEKYPDNPLVSSAKIEIENLGVEPEKIIEKQIKDVDAK